MLQNSGAIAAVELELRPQTHAPAEPIPDPRHSAEDDAAFDRALHRHTAYEALAGSYHPGHHEVLVETKGS